MKWLMKFLNREPPPHIKKALDTAASATEAVAEAHSAADAYWQARIERDVANRLRLAKVDATLSVKRGRKGGGT